jgi:hypothetical protein
MCACGGGLLSLFGFPSIRGAEILWADNVTGLLINVGLNYSADFWEFSLSAFFRALS